MKTLLLEKVPLLLLAAGTSVVAYTAQKSGGAMVLEGSRFLGNRLGQALVSYVAYLGKTLWPAALSFYYPRAVTLPPLEVVAAGAVLVAVTTAVLLRARAQPYLAVGWLWYAGTLVPVIGVVQVGSQALADRYTYIPHIGLFVGLVWLLGEATRRAPHGRLAGAGAAAALVGTCALLAGTRAGAWRDSEALMRSALAVDQKNWHAEVNLGVALDGKGRAEEAEVHYRSALQLNPASPEAHYSLAAILARRGNHPDAVAHYQAARAARPGAPPFVLQGLVRSLSALGRNEEAITLMEQALRLEPRDAGKHCDLGRLLAASGRLGEAERAFRVALGLDGTLAAGHNYLGIVLAQQGRVQEAAEHFVAATRLDPAYAAAKENLDRLRRRGEAPPPSRPLQ